MLCVCVCFKIKTFFTADILTGVTNNINDCSVSVKCLTYADKYSSAIIHFLLFPPVLFILEHVKASAVKKVIVPPCFLAETLPNITMNRQELLKKKKFYLIFLQNFVKNVFKLKYKVNPGVQATQNLIKRC